MSGAVLDTSIFVAVEQGRPLRRALPDEVTVSVITLAELELGVLVAREPEARAQRLATLTRVREETAGLPADQRVASAYARLAVTELAAASDPCSFAISETSAAPSSISAIITRAPFSARARE